MGRPNARLDERSVPRSRKKYLTSGRDDGDMKTAVQLYSLRSLDEPLPRTLERVADAGFDGAEFAGLGDSTVESLREELDRLDLEVAGAHIPYEDAESDLSEQVATCRGLGTDALVIPILDSSYFATRRGVEKTARHLSDLAGVLADYDLRLCYHNHDHEFVTVDTDDGERTAWECLVDWTSAVDFELDSGWAHAAGMDPIDLLDTYGDRIPRVHLKDVIVDDDADRGGRPVDLGEGDVDVEGCITAARNAEADWLIFEHDNPADPVASLQRAGNVLTAGRGE